MSYEVVNDQIKNSMLNIARRIQSVLPRGWGFTLMIFSYGERGDLYYTSSARREDMIATMKRSIEREELNVPCTHERLNEDGICRNCGVDLRGAN